MTTTVQQTLFTQAFINHASFSPFSVPANAFTERTDLPGYLDIAKAVSLLKEAYKSRHNDHRDSMILLGMLDTIQQEMSLINVHYARSISLGDVTLKYELQERLVEQPVTAPVAVSPTPATPAAKDLSPYFQEPAKPAAVADEFDISALGNVDFDAVNERVAEKQAGGGEVLEANDECEGGGCKI